MDDLKSAPPELARAILLAVAEQSREITTAIEYFLRERSVGEMCAVMELIAKRVKKPKTVIIKLLEIGFLERGEGCYNLSSNVREWIRKQKQMRGTYFDPAKIIEPVIKELGIK